MNRNVLKIIALITMIVDHIGVVFFPNIVIFQIIGRLSFPIFAFFIAEGWYYTKSKKKYMFLLLIFMLISWVPYCIVFNLPFYTVNVLGVFLLSTLGMLLIDKIRLNSDTKGFYISSFCFLLFVCLILEGLAVIVEGALAVALPIVFYAYREKPVKRIVAATIILLTMAVTNVIVGPIEFETFVQFFGLLAIIPIVCYNNTVGRLNLKYLFYITYPLHLFVIMLIKLI